MEGLVEVLFDDSRSKRMIRIGTFASPPIQQALTTFLRES